MDKFHMKTFEPMPLASFLGVCLDIQPLLVSLPHKILTNLFLPEGLVELVAMLQPCASSLKHGTERRRIALCLQMFRVSGWHLG